MSNRTNIESNEPPNPLKGENAWVITDGKAGMLVQAKGIVEALEMNPVFKQVNPEGIWRYLSPWGPVNPKEKFGQPGTQFAPPWPKLVIATGRSAIPYVRSVRRLVGVKTYTVILQDPKTGPSSADLIWVPAHDLRRGPNVTTTLTAPHSFTPSRLKDLRTNLPEDIASLPQPRIAVILGGKNSVYKFTEKDDLRFENSLASLKDLGVSFMITPSRRSHKRIIKSADRATSGAPRLLWDGTGENPYPSFLAAADALIVTADSVNMCGEACATGKPVYIFTPSGGSPKFKRFHDGLAAYGATRPMPEKFETLISWNYKPLNSSDTIANEIISRYSAQQAKLNTQTSHNS